MGLKSFFSKWSKESDQEALEKAEEESRMTPYERDLDQSEGFAGRETDSYVSNSWLGSEAIRSSGEFDKDRI